MLPKLSDEQRHLIEQNGTPLPLVDEVTSTTYVLLNVECIPDPQGGFHARIPCLTAYGEGETQEDAALAFVEALRALNGMTNLN